MLLKLNAKKGMGRGIDRTESDRDTERQKNIKETLNLIQ